MTVWRDVKVVFFKDYRTGVLSTYDGLAYGHLSPCSLSPLEMTAAEGEDEMQDGTCRDVEIACALVVWPIRAKG
jgi:hypothetical protein